jgi:hypothetical protein
MTTRIHSQLNLALGAALLLGGCIQTEVDDSDTLTTGNGFFVEGEWQPPTEPGTQCTFARTNGR